MNQEVITSPDKESTVVIDQGELVSYSFFGEELIHQKGDRGWRNADTEMFPIIGPTEANNFRVDTERGEAIQDQHGLLRELAYEVYAKKESSIGFQKSYKKNTEIKNSKYPVKSTEALLSWPYDFEFNKRFHLANTSLIVTFEVNAENDMPFMLGYHPAFKLSGKNTEHLAVNNTKIKLQDVLDVGSIAYKVLGTNSIILKKHIGQNIEIKTKGFDNFMLWTEVTNMICIEPISAYPYTSDKALGKDLFMTAKGPALFEIEMRPF